MGVCGALVKNSWVKLLQLEVIMLAHTTLHGVLKADVDVFKLKSVNMFIFDLFSSFVFSQCGQNNLFNSAYSANTECESPQVILTKIIK